MGLADIEFQAAAELEKVREAQGITVFTEKAGAAEHGEDLQGLTEKIDAGWHAQFGTEIGGLEIDLAFEPGVAAVDRAIVGEGVPAAQANIDAIDDPAVVQNGGGADGIGRDIDVHGQIIEYGIEQLGSLTGGRCIVVELIVTEQRHGAERQTFDRKIDLGANAAQC